MQDRKILVVGDVHGCLIELCELLAKADYDPLGDDLIFVGDLINRGPDSLGVMELVHSLPCDVIMGNHEMAFLTYARDPKPPIKKPHYDLLLKEMGRERDYWLDWLETLPLYIETHNLMIIHGGLVPDLHPRDTDPHLLTRIRTWDGVGQDLHNSDDPPWYNFYHGDKTVVFGHWAQQGLVIKDNIIGLDSGCVWGGHLSAMRFPERKIFQVKAKRAYCFFN